VGFNPSTQRHYRRLIYYLYIHSYMFRSYDHHQVEKYILVYAACLTRIYKLNLGCLHPVARVVSDDVGFNPSTQRHYRRLIYYLYISIIYIS
jgi:hypothetical protein